VLLGTFCWIVLSLSFSASISLCLSPPTISKATASGGTKTTAAISSDDCQHYKWLIIGGGIHGVGIASRLVGEGKIERNDHQNELLLVDEHSELLYSWKERTSATGMTFLRSAVGFHLDLPAQGLKTFASNAKANANANANANHARSTKKKNNNQLTKKARRQSKNNQHRSKHRASIAKNNNAHYPTTNSEMLKIGRDYQRPALELFNDHCDMVIDKYRLKNHHFQGRVESIDLCNNNNNNDGDEGPKDLPLRVVIRSTASAASEDSHETTTITVSADNIVFAVGNDDPVVPEWAAHLVSTVASKHCNHRGAVYHLLQLPNGGDREKNNASIMPFDEKVDAADEARNNGADKENDSYRHRQRCVAIIGGGISAVHKALELVSKSLSSSGNNDSNTEVDVHIISRHELREQQFDTHQDWMMTNELAQRSLEHGGTGLTQRQKDFSNIRKASDRRQVIARERVPGTVPSYMTRASRKNSGIESLEGAIQKGFIKWHVAGVAEASIASAEEDWEERATKTIRYTASTTDSGHEKNGINHHNGNNTSTSQGKESLNAQTYTLQLTNGDSIGPVNEIILATGLGKMVPGHQIIHPLALKLNLPLSPCGYPLLDQSLLWKQNDCIDSDGEYRENSFCSSRKRSKTANTSTNIFMSGGLAELELGPSARNIAGARMAAERIAAAMVCK